MFGEQLVEKLQKAGQNLKTESHKKLKKASFSERKDPEIIPEMSNYFIIQHYGERSSLLEEIPPRTTLIELTEHMCDWLFDSGLTKRRLLK